MSGNGQITSDEKELIIARLKVLPSSRMISIGSQGSFSRDELIQEIEKNSAVGKKIIEVQMKFLTAFKQGKIYRDLAAR
ncbi:Uncharacterised protein [uncultured archaeon]|nr:Uncharacterised protein [uncultured archaeon]